MCVRVELSVGGGGRDFVALAGEMAEGEVDVEDRVLEGVVVVVTCRCCVREDVRGGVGGIAALGRGCRRSMIEVVATRGGLLGGLASGW